MSLHGKKILVGITGSIAAYKMPHFVRLLVKSGAEVRVVMTTSARDFVSALSLSTVSKNPVLSDTTNGDGWNNHVALGLWADLMVVAPCSANTLAKFANGICDNLLCAVYLSARCPVLIAPAMDEDMWAHPSTSNNLQRVTGYGNKIIPVGTGELASGLNGPGRMAEPEEMLQLLGDYFSEKASMKGLKALVTAGPTYERLDPVRFIGNFSSGKMGYAIAKALADEGAEVILVSGPVHLPPPTRKVQLIAIESAEEMYEACHAHYTDCDIAVLAAAVADFRPAVQANEKIKKTNGALNLQLEATADILASLGKIKKQSQTLVGFALETNNELDHARQKLANKNADMIVLNSLRDTGAGFGTDTNKVTLLVKEQPDQELALMSKAETAKAIVNKINVLRNHVVRV